MELYQEIFGNYNYPIIRKLYAIGCGKSGPLASLTMLEALENMKLIVKLSVDDVGKRSEPGPGEEEGPKQEEGGGEPAPSQPGEAKQEEKPQADEDIKFYEYSLSKYLDGTSIKDYNFTADIISRFEDKYLRGLSTEGIRRGQTGTAIESYYWRYLKMKVEDNET